MILHPCRACKGIENVLILACDWDPEAWGALPPGAVGAVYCTCGAWKKWPGRVDVVGATGVTPDRLPRLVQVTLRQRGHHEVSVQKGLL